ncbi:DUF2817 domain-containing protein [Adhaeretor mobilis]|uniref:Murein peptide amidase A n=1 Tax=Adhaeretor mobilis TaxID=1930276 RepID=A0A517MX49_9BACT|nr:DUF2817 domain-containing protein [Adhaeretor mobilis]QDS99451.1 murein peptide amidase A [Adhaeretor mobilis]
MQFEIPSLRRNNLRTFIAPLWLSIVVANIGSGFAAGEPSAVAEPNIIEVGKSFEGRPIECIVYGKGSDVLLVIATIHGDEDAGTPLMKPFQEWLIANPQELTGKQVVIVPVANPDGFAAQKRFNVRGVDLNRNFPAGNWELKKVNLHGDTPLSEPESRVLMRVVCRYFPSRVISIHQPINCIDYDGPGEELAKVMAEKCPLKVKKLGGRPGSFGSFVGESLGKPIITLEMPKDETEDPDELWQRYGEALIAALRWEPKEELTPEQP